MADWALGRWRYSEQLLVAAKAVFFLELSSKVNCDLLMDHRAVYLLTAMQNAVA